MKNRVIGILIILAMIILTVPSNVFAYGGIDTNISIGGSGTNAINSSVPITNKIVGILQTAGSIISVIALIIIGMRYMFSSIEEKAQIKGVIGYYITGCVLVFATSNVLAFAYDIVNDVQHTYGEITIVSDATCSKTGTAKRVCTGEGGLCNCTEDKPHVITVTLPINPNKHNESEWIETVPATCTEDGLETRICNNGCGKEETQTISKRGHNYEYGIIKSATCTEDGYEGDKCTRCGDEKNTIILAATGHSYTKEDTSPTYLKAAATCTAKAKYYYSCANNCGAKDTTKEPFEAGELAHNFSEIKKPRYLVGTEGTCEKMGIKSKYYLSCTVCEKAHQSEIFEIYEEHRYSSTELKPATCISVGEYGMACQWCGDQKPDSQVSYGTEFDLDNHALGYEEDVRYETDGQRNEKHTVVWKRKCCGDEHREKRDCTFTTIYFSYPMQTKHVVWQYCQKCDEYKRSNKWVNCVDRGLATRCKSCNMLWRR